MKLPDRIDYGMAHYTDEPNPTPIVDAVVFTVSLAIFAIKVLIWII